MDKKCKKVDRKFRMIPKMTVNVTPKMTLKKQRMTPRMVNMTPKMTPRTELLQMIYKRLTMTRSILVMLRMTPKMTPKKIMNSLLFKQTSEMIVWGAINDCFGKEK